MRIVIATNNQNKLKEISKILSDVKLLTLKDVDIDFDVDETGLTFIKNAEKKAREYYELCEIPVIAEDSGLCLVGLNDMPGVFSKRFFEGKSEEEGNQMIIDNLKDINNREAYYIAVYCYYDGVNTVFAEGRTYGIIDDHISGDNGFAYDRIFISKDTGKKMSLMSDNEKAKISHRKRGLEKLRKKINF